MFREENKGYVHTNVVDIARYEGAQMLDDFEGNEMKSKTKFILGWQEDTKGAKKPTAKQSC